MYFEVTIWSVPEISPPFVSMFMIVLFYFEVMGYAPENLCCYGSVKSLIDGLFSKLSLDRARLPYELVGFNPKFKAFTS